MNSVPGRANTKDQVLSSEFGRVEGREGRTKDGIKVEGRRSKVERGRDSELNYFPSRFEDLIYVREDVVLEGFDPGDGGVHASHAEGWGVEVLERELGDAGDDLAGETARAGGLVHHDDAIGLFDRLDNGLLVEGDEGAQVDDFGLDSLFGELIGGGEAVVDVVAIGDVGEVLALPSYLCFSKWNEEVAFGDFFFDLVPAIELLDLVDDDRIAVTDG